MAKIFKLTGYLIDPNGDWSTDDITTEVENLDLISHHVKCEEADIGEFEDDSVLNRCDCPIEECEKYFSKVVLNNNEHIKCDALCRHCEVTAICHKSRCSENKCGRHTDNYECLCVNIEDGEVCKDYRPR